MGLLYKLIGVGFALLVQPYRAMRRPQAVGRVTSTDLPRFFCIVTSAKSFLFHAETGRFIGSLILCLIMKDKKQNEELQSRREFFKKAAKGALPILGAIVLAGAPAIVKATAKAPMGCNYGCAGGCDYSCYGSCHSDCLRTCYGTCKTTCQYSCTSTCRATCSGSCSGSCYGMSY